MVRQQSHNPTNKLIYNKLQHTKKRYKKQNCPSRDSYLLQQKFCYSASLKMLSLLIASLPL